jgi:4,5-dihydroxyphthalate decarboxylase
VRAQAEEPYPYGIKAGRHRLEAFCRNCHDQGVTARRMTPEDLFPTEVRTTAKL